jgi:hypothetical protein
MSAMREMARTSLDGAAFLKKTVDRRGKLARWRDTFLYMYD